MWERDTNSDESKKANKIDAPTRETHPESTEECLHLHTTVGTEKAFTLHCYLCGELDESVMKEASETKKDVRATTTATLYGAVMISRRDTGYFPWQFGDDQSALLGVFTSKEKAMLVARQSAWERVRLMKTCNNKQHGRVGFGVRDIIVGEQLPKFEWNDCRGYCVYYVSERT